MAGKPKCDDQVLEVIDQHWREFLFPPPIQYIIDNSCLMSKSTAFGAIRRLEKAGKVKLVETGEGHKVYANWAWHSLYSRSRQLEENE